MFLPLDWSQNREATATMRLPFLGSHFWEVVVDKWCSCCSLQVAKGKLDSHCGLDFRCSCSARRVEDRCECRQQKRNSKKSEPHRRDAFEKYLKSKLVPDAEEVAPGCPRKQLDCGVPSETPTSSRRSSSCSWDILRRNALGQLQGHVNYAMEEEVVYHVWARGSVALVSTEEVCHWHGQESTQCSYGDCAKFCVAHWCLETDAWCAGTHSCYGEVMRHVFCRGNKHAQKLWSIATHLCERWHGLWYPFLRGQILFFRACYRFRTMGGGLKKTVVLWLVLANSTPLCFTWLPYGGVQSWRQTSRCVLLCGWFHLS